MLCSRSIAISFLSLCLLSTGLLTSAEASAAELTLKSRAFRDDTTDLPSVSGSSIVGVRLGEAPTTIDKNRIFVAISGKPETLPLCVHAKTGDAAFWSLSEYAVGVIGTARLDYPTRFPALLAKYAGDTFAVHAVYNASCTFDSEGILVPAVLRPGELPRSLTIFVNSANQMLEAALHLDGKPVTAVAPCAEINGPRLAFQWSCRIAVKAPLPAGDYQLRIAAYTDTGRPVSPITAPIRLPRMTP